MATADKANSFAHEPPRHLDPLGDLTRGFPRDDAAKMRTAIVHGDEDQPKRPFRNRVGGAVGHINRADIARPGRLQVDAPGKAVPFQFTDQPQLGRGVEDRPINEGGAMTDDEHVRIADLVA